MVKRWISSLVILLLVFIIGGLLGSRLPIFGQRNLSMILRHPPKLFSV